MPSPAKYKRKAFRFNDSIVEQATLLSQDDKLAKTVVEWRDIGTVGLTIRITRNKPVWYLRRREMTIRLCDVGHLPLDQARYIAKQVQLAAYWKRDLRNVVNVLLSFVGFPDPDASESARARFDQETAERLDRGLAKLQEVRKLPVRPAAPFWTWKTLTEKFLAYKKPKLKGSYREEYAHYLELEQFAAINDKMVRDVKLRDLEKLRDAIAVKYAKSAVHRAVTQSKAMLSWAWKYHATASGLEEVQYEWWTRWSFEYQTRERTRTPTVEEIARTLLIAEKFKHLAEGEHETYPGTLGALWGVCLTAQRTGAFLKLRPDRLYDASKVVRRLRGWKIANWTADEMKGGRDGGRPHSLPIPPDALKILQNYHALSGGTSKWMFTGRDPKKHITQSAINLAMYRLQGRVYDHTVKQKPLRKGKPGPKPRPKKERTDLFALYGIERWSLHDCRRTIATYLDDKRLGGAATAILGHKTSLGKTKEREKLAPVTEQHYSRSQKIDLKAEGMALWVKTLLTAYAKESRNFRDLRGDQKAA
ncbi:integrase [Bradyrhizobium sp. USDA 372]